jgi:hypothetical protein
MIPDLKRQFDVSVVVDYQDPWGARNASGIKKPSKEWLAHKLAEWVEKRSLIFADGITSVSEGTNSMIKEKYRSVSQKNFGVIPIGGDPDDFNVKVKIENKSLSEDLESDAYKVSYIGSIWPGAQQVVETFVSAIAIIKQQQPDFYRKLRILFIGTSCLPGESDRFRVLPIARSFGVDDCVREHPGRVPYLDAVNVMQNSDLLLLFGSVEPHYASSKIFPILLSNKPALAIVNSCSSTAEIVNKTGGVSLVTFNTRDPVANKAEEIAQELTKVSEKPKLKKPFDINSVKPFLGKEIAGKFVSEFQRALASGLSGTVRGVNF